LLVPLDRAGAREIAEVAKKTGAGSSRAICATSSEKIPSAVGSGHAPESPVTAKRSG
jgi:hypothetical protein